MRWLPRAHRPRRPRREVEVRPRLGMRFPFIVETALKMRQKQFIIDGEICVLDVQGVSDFNALHSNRHNAR
jgi:bifunctional non-homologous end joining protein LigD